MAQKRLHELLTEDQSPFLLKDYIADRRSQLNKPPLKSSSSHRRETLFGIVALLIGKIGRGSRIWKQKEEASPVDVLIWRKNSSPSFFSPNLSRAPSSSRDEEICSEEVEKEQCSPVCVLDRASGEEDDENDGDFSVCPTVHGKELDLVQPAKEVSGGETEKDEDVNDEIRLMYETRCWLQRLASDLIEELREEVIRNDLAWRVTRRAVVSACNTIDGMVELDLSRDVDGWVDDRLRMSDAVVEIAHAILGLLVAELLGDLARCGASEFSNYAV